MEALKGGIFFRWPTKLYIAGPMRGFPRYNFDAFHNAADVLRRQGYLVVNPAEMDLQIGFDPDRGMEEQGFDLHQALLKDFREIVDCDGIALLPGWEDSVGSRIEAALACYAGLALVELIDGRLEPIAVDKLPKIGLPNETQRLWSELPGVKAIRLQKVGTASGGRDTRVTIDVVDSETGEILYEFGERVLRLDGHSLQIKLDAEVRLDEEAA